MKTVKELISKRDNFRRKFLQKLFAKLPELSNMKISGIYYDLEHDREVSLDKPKNLSKRKHVYTVGLEQNDSEVDIKVIITVATLEPIV